MKLEDAVARAVALLARTGISDWGLNVPDELPGTLVQSGEVSGCNSDTCGHHSHDPAAGWFRWVPPQGAVLVGLGSETAEGRDGGVDSYYALRRDGEDLYILHRSSLHFHGGLRVIESREVPAYMLAALASA